MALDKDLLRTVQERTEESVIPYVSTYNPNDPEMFHVIINNEPKKLQEDEKMRNILSRFKFIKSKVNHKQKQNFRQKRVMK